jgi:hypothetical protein
METARSTGDAGASEQMGVGPARFENVEPEDEQILPPREQRELDAL